MIVSKRNEALADLEYYASYFARVASSAVMIRFLDSAEQTMQLILHFPGLGSRFESSIPTLKGLRHHPIHHFPNHFIFYLEHPSGIEVLRVTSAVRNLANLFKEIDN